MIHELFAVSIIFNVLSAGFAVILVKKKGGAWLKSSIFPQKICGPLPSIPKCSVDGRILLIGDSHLALHSWSEYTNIPFSNRAVSGSRIKDIDLEAIEGSPSFVVVSTGTNDIQENKLTISDIKSLLQELFDEIKYRWPEANIIFISPPYPNVKLYEKYITAKYPNINMPKPNQIDSIRGFVGSIGVQTLQAQSANIDGLHVDVDSALLISQELEKIFLVVDRS